MRDVGRSDVEPMQDATIEYCQFDSQEIVKKIQAHEDPSRKAQSRNLTDTTLMRDEINLYIFWLESTPKCASVCSCT